MESYIHLNQVKLYAYHGVYEQENKVGNEFIIDLKIKTDLLQAAKSDDLKDTISYGDIYKTLKEEMKIKSNLLEHVAWRIINRLYKDFAGIQEIEISLGKLNPPFGGELESASITLCVSGKEKDLIQKK